MFFAIEICKTTVVAFINILRHCYFFIFILTDTSGRNSRMRNAAAVPNATKGPQASKTGSRKGGKGHEGGGSEANSRSSSAYGRRRHYGPGGSGLGGRGRGRNFSGDSSGDVYPFQLDGPPAYGEVVPDPAFVTPIIGGMAYYYGDGQFSAQGGNNPPSGLDAEELLKSNIKSQM